MPPAGGALAALAAALRCLLDNLGGSGRSVSGSTLPSQVGASDSARSPAQPSPGGLPGGTRLVGEVGPENLTALLAEVVVEDSEEVEGAPPRPWGTYIHTLLGLLLASSAPGCRRTGRFHTGRTPTVMLRADHSGCGRTADTATRAAQVRAHSFQSPGRQRLSCRGTRNQSGSHQQSWVHRTGPHSRQLQVTQEVVGGPALWHWFHGGSSHPESPLEWSPARSRQSQASRQAPLPTHKRTCLKISGSPGAHFAQKRKSWLNGRPRRKASQWPRTAKPHEVSSQTFTAATRTFLRFGILS